MVGTIALMYQSARSILLILTTDIVSVTLWKGDFFWGNNKIESAPSLKNIFDMDDGGAHNLIESYWFWDYIIKLSYSYLKINKINILK